MATRFHLGPLPAPGPQPVPVEPAAHPQPAPRSSRPMRIQDPAPTRTASPARAAGPGGGDTMRPAGSSQTVTGSPATAEAGTSVTPVCRWPSAPVHLTGAGIQTGAPSVVPSGSCADWSTIAATAVRDRRSAADRWAASDHVADATVATTGSATRPNTISRRTAPASTRSTPRARGLHQTRRANGRRRFDRGSTATDTSGRIGPAPTLSGRDHHATRTVMRSGGDHSRTRPAISPGSVGPGPVPQARPAAPPRCG